MPLRTNAVVCSVTAIICLVLLTSGFAAAEPKVEPTSEQRELYERAFQAYRLNQFEDSAAYLDAAVRIQPFDLLYYSKGRAHFRLGECKEALTAYELAVQAPAYEASQESMSERAQMAIAELKQSCPGELATSCLVAGVEVEIDDRAAIACGKVTRLAPGSYRVLARLAGKEEEHTVTVVPIERTTVAIELVPDREVIVQRYQEPATPWVPPTLIAGGAALLVGSLVVDVAWLGPAMDQLARMQMRPTPRDEIVEQRARVRAGRVSVIAGYVMSTALAGVGTGLILFRSSPEAEPTLSAGVSAEGVQGVLRW